MPPSAISSADKNRLLDLVTNSAALAAAAELTKSQRQQQQQRHQAPSPPPPPLEGDAKGAGMSPTAMASVQAALAALQAGQMSLNQVSYTTTK